MPKRKRHLSENPCDEVSEYFNKRFSFTRDDTWLIPNASEIYTHEKWEINNFQQLKSELNDVKGQLNQFNLDEWSQHTKTRDPAGYVFRELKKHIKPELLTQAWCKFYECLCQFPLICDESLSDEQLNSVHLCEAPGAFVCALNHFLSANHQELNWGWIVNSLNPEYEGNNLTDMIPDKRLFKHTKDNWRFGADATGDITQYYNYKNITEEAEILGKILLVTADGSVNCMSNPGEQECLVEHLHFCEVVTALTILAKGGTFVIKLFTMFECSTICLMYLLNNCFSQIHVFKPCTSKSGNSEVYVICLNYGGKISLTKFLQQYKTPENNLCMFPLKNLPDSFMNQILECNKYFMSKQIKTITNNIKCFENVSKNEYRKNDHIKNSIAHCFILKYKLKTIKTYQLLTSFTPITSDVIFPENFTVTCSTFLLSKQINLDFHVGKKITRVFYSIFCDDGNYLNLSDFSHKTNLKLLNLHDFNLINFSYNNNEHNATNTFKLFYDSVREINCDTSVIINGCLFLTRFEAGLFYLFMSCFTGVYYYAGVVVLKVVNERIFSVRQLFDEINTFLLGVSKIDDSFDCFVLKFLPDTLLEYERFVSFLKCYNNKTIEAFFCVESDL